MRQKVWKKERKTKAPIVQYCRLCGRPFACLSERRVYCSPRHRGIYTAYVALKRKKEAGTLTGWRVGLLERLERLIQKEREKVEAELAAKRERQEGGEGQ